MSRNQLRWTIVSALFLAFFFATAAAGAETMRLRVSHGHGLLYLPLMVMRDQHLIEKRAQESGLGDVTVEWAVVDGGDAIEDSVLAGKLDIAGIGVPGFLTLWSRTHGKKNEVVGIGALSTSSLWLNTNRADLRSIRDLSTKDRIAVPGIRTSLSAVVLQMAAASTFGDDHYNRLDRMTVTMSHPDAMRQLSSEKPTITAHFASPPFSHQEVMDPRVHRVFNSSELLGNITLDVVLASRAYADANAAMIDAFMQAQDDANALIAKNPQAAAQIFVRVAGPDFSEADIEKILDDPNTQYSTVPNGIMRYALFMGKAGTIKVRPASWDELFIKRIHPLAGS